MSFHRNIRRDPAGGVFRLPTLGSARRWKALDRYRSGAPIEPTTWIRASAKDVQLIRSLGVRETGMLASASDYHTFHKFKPGGRNQAAQTYLEAVQITLESGIRPRLHLEDTTRAPMEFMQPFIEAVQEMAASYGADLRPKFPRCDTMGRIYLTMMWRCRAAFRAFSAR
ncbi:MAG: hypothetical protein U0528_13785 [Anaerolineae bacterium]